jgi:hypothetical protein
MATANSMPHGDRETSGDSPIQALGITGFMERWSKLDPMTLRIILLNGQNPASATRDGGGLSRRAGDGPSNQQRPSWTQAGCHRSRSCCGRLSRSKVGISEAINGTVTALWLRASNGRRCWPRG